MDPFTIAMLGSSILSAGGQIAGGIGARKTAELNAFNMETEAKLNKAQAMQMAQARIDEYDSASSSNIAAFAAAGRDIGSDRSVKAFMDRQKEIIGKDLGRMDTQAQFQQVQLRQQAAGERRAGRDAQTASLFSAADTLSSGIYKYQTAK